MKRSIITLGAVAVAFLGNTLLAEEGIGIPAKIVKDPDS